MTLKEELAQLHHDEAAIKKRITEIYQASLDAPAEEKVCEDYLAELLGSSDDTGFIKYPLTVMGITYRKDNNPVDRITHSRREVGTYVAVRPVNDEKTYLGIYIGEFALGMHVAHHPQSQVLEVGCGFYNPAMYVPALKKVVYGAGSWWTQLESADDLKQITDADIDDVWYVKALRSMGGGGQGDH